MRVGVLLTLKNQSTLFKSLQMIKIIDGSKTLVFAKAKVNKV
jgi:hypothetical protein